MKKPDKPEFDVWITETLQRKVVVNANSQEEAEEIVKERYRKQEIILDEYDFLDVKFNE